MKQLVYLLFLIILLSCSKHTVVMEQVPVISTSGSIQYKLNGSQIIMDNANSLTGERVICAKQLRNIGLPETRYLINAQKESNNFVTFSVVTDSLFETSYHYDSASINNNFGVFTFDLDNHGRQISLFFSTDQLDINISSYKDARITGTFSGRMSVVTGSFDDYATRGSIIITEGAFNNVPVNY